MSSFFTATDRICAVACFLLLGFTLAALIPEPPVDAPSILIQHRR